MSSALSGQYLGICCIEQKVLNLGPGLWREGHEDTRNPIGTRLDLSHIHIFGSVCYCHIHAYTRKKLDPSGEKGLLVGYSEISKAYRVYIPTRKRIIVSRDV